MKRLAAIAAISLLGVATVGATASAEGLSGTIVITGSTSVEPILTDMADEFMAQNPDVDIQYTGSGSSAGITDTKAGTNNIGASSRYLHDDEQEDGLNTEIFAYDGIAVIVNPANEAVEDITPEQLADIYSGKITNWSELGGEDQDIFVVSREESSGTRDAFEELIGLEDAGGLSGNASVSEGNGPVQAAVAENEYAIGYVSFSYVDDTVKPLTVGGVEATAENALNGTYPLSRPFLFCWFDENVTEAGQAFLDFALTDEAQEFVVEHGGITVAEEEEAMAESETAAEGDTEAAETTEETTADSEAAETEAAESETAAE